MITAMNIEKKADYIKNKYKFNSFLATKKLNISNEIQQEIRELKNMSNEKTEKLDGLMKKNYKTTETIFVSLLYILNEKNCSFDMLILELNKLSKNKDISISLRFLLLSLIDLINKINKRSGGELIQNENYF